MKSKSSLKIKFVGGKNGEAAPRFLTDGNIRIELPINQSRAFSHSQAKQILAVAPELYKPVLRRRFFSSSARALVK